MTRFLLICFGGAVGTGARYLATLWAARALGPNFPFGTLLVNVCGSFLLGFLMETMRETGPVSPDLRAMLATGVLGGFTTYSAFNYETTAYFRDGLWWMGFLNAGITLVTCFLAGLFGLALAKLAGGR